MATNSIKLIPGDEPVRIFSGGQSVTFDVPFHSDDYLSVTVYDNSGVEVTDLAYSVSQDISSGGAGDQAGGVVNFSSSLTDLGYTAIVERVTDPSFDGSAWGNTSIERQTRDALSVVHAILVEHRWRIKDVEESNADFDALLEQIAALQVSVEANAANIQNLQTQIDSIQTSIAAEVVNNPSITPPVAVADSGLLATFVADAVIADDVVVSASAVFVPPVADNVTINGVGVL